MKKTIYACLVMLTCLLVAACANNSAESNVEIVLPLNMVAASAESFDANAFVETNRYESAAVNEADKTITIIMTQTRHKEFMEEKRNTLADIFDSLVDGEDTPYIKNIEHDSDYKNFTIDVDANEYANAVLDMTPLLLSIHAEIYQRYAGAEDVSVKVTIRDNDTQEDIKVFDY